MNRETFVSLTRLIEHHPVFHTANESGAQQRPCGQQLTLTLERLGVTGLGHLWDIFGVGNGTVPLYTNRVVEAIYDHVSEFIRWPGVQEREMISLRMAEHGFPGCIGFVDGTDVIFAHRPKKDGETFFNRKKRYSYNLQLVCDDRKAIRLCVAGWPGSLADSTICKNARPSTSSWRYFSSNAYAVSKHTIPVFRQSACLMACERTLQRAFCRGKGAHRTRQWHSLVAGRSSMAFVPRLTQRTML
ncbi:hypothetical protein PsorP6_016763 [Peronosclerospora sorghi]|uniref:Uncharacterized protein n=1 Tax=Peronosclerospora sorghi TaxID=230839 RepID=A0ACC0WCX5_9STRA|nr:hypothetical protein PsorP6_016763 [Peronosclerospora sorghi]